MKTGLFCFTTIIFLTSCSTTTKITPRMWVVERNQGGGTIAYTDYETINDKTERRKQLEKDFESRVQCPEAYTVQNFEIKSEQYATTCYMPTVDTYNVRTNATIYSGLRTYSGTATSTVTQYGTESYACTETISWSENKYTCDWDKVNQVRWSKLTTTEKIPYLVDKCNENIKEFRFCASLAVAYSETNQTKKQVTVLETICEADVNSYPPEKYTWAVEFASNSCFRAANNNVYEKHATTKAIEYYKKGCELKKEGGGNDSLYSCSFLAAYTKNKNLLKENIQGPLSLCSESETKGCYDLACIYSIMGNTNESLKYLRKSLEGGYKDWDHIATDPDLATIRKTTTFNKLIDDFKLAAEFQEAPAMKLSTPSEEENEKRNPASKK